LLELREPAALGAAGGWKQHRGQRIVVSHFWFSMSDFWYFPSHAWLVFGRNNSEMRFLVPMLGISAFLGASGAPGGALADGP
jgi:hypothetical protein